MKSIFLNDSFVEKTVNHSKNFDKRFDKWNSNSLADWPRVKNSALSDVKTACTYSKIRDEKLVGFCFVMDSVLVTIIFFLQFFKYYFNVSLLKFC